MKSLTITLLVYALVDFVRTGKPQSLALARLLERRWRGKNVLCETASRVRRYNEARMRKLRRNASSNLALKFEWYLNQMSAGSIRIGV